MDRVRANPKLQLVRCAVFAKCVNHVVPVAGRSDTEKDTERRREMESTEKGREIGREKKIETRQSLGER